MILPIVGYGASVLKQQAVEITKDYPELPELIENMFTTMYAANGVGLAAVQIGILKRVVVIDTGEGLMELVNPEIISVEGVQEGYEGCLSVPGKRGWVERPMTVTLKAQDRHGNEHTYTADGFTARAFCHEIDHLDGVLFVEHTDALENND